MKRPTLFLICGLPGSGKSTHAEKLAKEESATIMSPDEALYARGISFFDEKARAEAEGEQWQEAQELLKQGQSVILENGFWGRQERDEKRLAAQALGARVELHYLSAPVDELWRRIDARNQKEASWNDTPLTRDRLEQAAAQIQVPDVAELELFD